MRKEVKYLLKYREEGEEREVEISIDFVSNRILKKFSDLVLLGAKATKANDRISDIHTELAGEERTEDQQQKLKEEIEKCSQDILEFNNNGYFEKRIDILERILVDNGYKNDKKLMSPDFWEDCVDPSDVMEFLFFSVYKDVDLKKKMGNL